LDESGKFLDIAALMTRRLRCESCARRFRPQDISLVESAPQYSVFRLRCAMCDSQRLVIGVQHQNAIRTYATDLDTAEWNYYRRLPRLDADDVVRVARMLKTYEGDFSDVLEDPILDEAKS
jgi:hypothetical protein